VGSEFVPAQIQQPLLNICVMILKLVCTIRINILNICCRYIMVIGMLSNNSKEFNIFYYYYMSTFKVL
jgi:hypothetical protein